MSQPALRPWLAAARCSSKFAPRSPGLSVRCHSTESSVPLETPSDWLAFRKVREERKLQAKFFEPYGSTQNKDNTFKLNDGLTKPKANATISSLLAAGAHFGHASSRMNPNFVPYAYGTRAGITIIDLDHTLPMLRQAAKVTRSIAAAGGIVVFIGTRPDLRPIVIKAAERLGPQGYYVGDRWMPGTLSNRYQFYGQDVIHGTRMIPDLAIILNPLSNLHALNEFAAHNIPTIAIIDSNADPRIVLYPIPANDENTRTAEMIAGVLSIAGREGISIKEKRRIAELEIQQRKSRQANFQYISNARSRVD